MTLNTNYKIPDITLNNIYEAIAKHGFDVALVSAYERIMQDVRTNPSSIAITEMLSWSYHLSFSSESEAEQTSKEKYMVAAAFCRKLAHRCYWSARKEGLAEYNYNFIQAIK